MKKHYGRRLRRRYGRSSGPGKFQGEAPWVEHFYEEGAPDEEASFPDAGGWYGLWRIDAKDQARWPELDGAYAVILYERSDGFVEGSVFASKKAADKVWAGIEEDTAGSEDY